MAEKKPDPIIEELKTKIKLHGISAKELGSGCSTVSVGATTTKTPVAIKYRKDDKTWTGRGR